MTRYLSRTLGAEEPHFSQSIAALERAGGHPAADIRLTSEIKQQVRIKIAELGLDPDDTTGDELYSALTERLKADDAKVRELLHIGSQPGDVAPAVRQFLEKLRVPKGCFVLKASVSRRLLKRSPPKLAMKRLGYRSLDSMLKREPVVLIYTAAAISESRNWHKRLLEGYSKLRPGDFESRQVGFFSPKSKRWEELSEEFVNSIHQNVLSFRELGDIVLLPSHEPVDGLAITTLLMCLEDINDIRSLSSFAKLQQVKPNFGQIIRRSIAAEPYPVANLAGQPIPWQMIQRYYGRLDSDYHPEAFEPHVQSEDLKWNDPGDILARLEPSLSFWQHTQSLGVLDNGQPISMNVLDVALSYCNHLPFADRVVRALRSNVWHELMMRYLDQHNLEEALQAQLSADLVEEPALAESF